jgi:MinD superfamily P-loop ATPase
MAVPVIRQLKMWAKPRPGQNVIIDVSPGTSCPVVSALRGSDFLLLVTEPTPFGLHDLKLAVQIGRELNIPMGVVINRDDGSASAIDDYCRSMDLPVMLRIPFMRSIAEGIAQGRALLEIDPAYRQSFHKLFVDIKTIVENKRDAATKGVLDVAVLQNF